MKCASLSFVLIAVLPVPAQSQSYPTRPLRFVSPYAPGGGTDIMARTLAQKMTEQLGQQVVVENRPGGGGIVGIESVAKAPPDGYTLLMGSKGPLTLNPALHTKLPYDTLRDLAPISLVASVPAVLVVHPSLPVKSVGELVALARARPGELTFSSSGTSGTGHMSGELLASMAGVKLVHVPYRGTGPATVAVLSGEVTFGFGNLVSLMPHIQSGRLRPLAVTSAKRLAAAPRLPTVAETGLPGYEYVTWYGVLVPAGTPREVIGRLNAAVVSSIKQPDTAERLTSEGGEVVGTTPEAFAAYLKAELKASAELVRFANLKPEP